MTISFNCQSCRKEVKAPDEAAGKRGKCPFCGKGNYIPAPAAAGKELDLAPIDERQEKEIERERQALLQAERDLLHDAPRPAAAEPVEPTEAKPDDIYHHVVNYCLDMADGKLDRAETHVEKLKAFGTTGKIAVDDFIAGHVVEEALNKIPPRVRNGFFMELKSKLK